MYDRVCTCGALESSHLPCTGDCDGFVWNQGQLININPPLRPYSKAAIPAPLRWDVWERDNFTCKRCGSRRYLTVDHILAERLGGLTEFANLQTLCRPCNSRKGVR
jgi:hypothetical protein